MIDADYFVETVQQYYKKSGRHTLPWRQDVGNASWPYRVLVSEFMLQQTQVNRVILKYNQWLEVFPTIESVATATLADCLRLWNGLGYNRRAKFLFETCRIIQQQYDGNVPTHVDDLVRMPGIGKNTAAAIAVYAYNQPHKFIETNIRTVYIHSFFPNQDIVSDSEIAQFVNATLDTNNPRKWYWALMDYGAYLKQSSAGNIQKSKHYIKQSKFKDSNRQLRGAVIRALTSGQKSSSQLKLDTKNDKRLPVVLNALLAEGLIEKTGVMYRLAGE